MRSILELYLMSLINLMMMTNKVTNKEFLCFPSLSYCSGSEVTKLFSCSTQVSTKFQLLIKTKITTNEEVSCFKSLRYCTYHANKC